ncbi:conjugal transfer pilus assembly protein TraU [Azospirillum sp. OGB3]|uniref:TraU family protein n=1 Tax=Azospirillum sp. OGB3 TaxID=2587012 RepID=UPI0016067C50|nr:TraU family protein [Azospirillum sp. OGB3]MBB3268339.1 conjugal transfer pilus assembly protein TraU [Azospirillum sp. OGB3]
MRSLFAAAALAVALFASPLSPAQADPACPNSQLFSGKLLTDICWSCIFPVKVAGIPLGGGNGRVPEGATSKSACLCSDRLGMPKPGLTIAMWQPARIVELVRKPGCSMALGGITLPIARRMQGTTGVSEDDMGDSAFYHYHTYAFPLLIMLDLFVDNNCVADGFFDFDLMMISELDPTWNNSELAFFTQPEAAVVANPIAQSACVADAVAATAGRPITKLFWCLGTWSTSIYPFSGWDEAFGGLAENTNVLAARSIAAAHRRGLSWRTMGDDALCGGRIDPMFPKSQYRWSMFFPLPEANGDHVTGESDWKWGMGKQIPGVGEDSMFILWRWVDCCSSFM